MMWLKVLEINIESRQNKASPSLSCCDNDLKLLLQTGWFALEMKLVFFHLRENIQYKANMLSVKLNYTLLYVSISLQCNYRDRRGASEHGLLSSVRRHQRPADRQRAPRVLRHPERSPWEGSLWGQQQTNTWTHEHGPTVFCGILHWTYIGLLYVN